MHSVLRKQEESACQSAVGIKLFNTARVPRHCGLWNFRCITGDTRGARGPPALSQGYRGLHRPQTSRSHFCAFLVKGKNVRALRWCAGGQVGRKERGKQTQLNSLQNIHHKDPTGRLLLLLSSSDHACR